MIEKRKIFLKTYLETTYVISQQPRMYFSKTYEWDFYTNAMFDFSTFN